MSNVLYQFGNFRFDAAKKVLWRGDEMISVTPKATDVLFLLLNERGNLVERQDLIDKVWSDSFVEEGNLNQAISALRKILGEASIQTVPRRGYRFTADVTEVQENGASGLLVERRTVSETLIEQTESFGVEGPMLSAGSTARRSIIASAAILFAVTVIGSAAWYFISKPFSKANARTSIGSIAVLPLRSFSADDSNGELRLRITDALITKLGRFDSLVVRPTSSVMRFAAEVPDPIEAGRALSVDAVLEGRVQQENGRLRVTLQLISVTDGEQLWSEQFDGRENEILNLQDQISNRFGQDLVLANTRDAVRKPIENSEAYEAYLKGRYLWNQRRLETYYKALEYFETSIRIDPEFALGYTGISDTYHLLQQRNAISTRDAFDKAEPAARKALDLDPNLSEAHVSMGAVNQVRHIRWADAETSYKRAIELNPNLPEAYGRLGMLYNSWGRFDEARLVLERGVALDPTSLNNAIYLGAYYFFSKNYEPAIKQFEHILEFAPRTERAHFFLRHIYELTEQYDKAVDHTLAERAIYRPDTVEPLREAYDKGGIQAFWRKQIELLENESKELKGVENHIASRYVLLGDLERACDYVEVNVENLGSMTNYGRVDPLFEKLWTHPRYIAIMERARPSK
ncbi:MAG TPA: winged helix-turn-helix domain-containing protein [Pyrinomonadaceae bacterium]|nr:winged helix-turn-helix domain-containing protein [Pyrinomonadaceae bacterium]